MHTINTAPGIKNALALILQANKRTPLGDVGLLVTRDMDDEAGVEVPVLVNIMAWKGSEVEIGDAVVVDDVPPHFSAGEVITLTPMEQERASNLWVYNEDLTREDMQFNDALDRWDNSNV